MLVAVPPLRTLAGPRRHSDRQLLTNIEKIREKSKHSEDFFHNFSFTRNDSSSAVLTARGFGTSFARESEKTVTVMKHPDCNPTSAPRPQDEHREPVSHTESLRTPTVTQNIPRDDIRIAPSGKDEEPSRQQLEQDVMATNPSLESMESRG